MTMSSSDFLVLIVIMLCVLWTFLPFFPKNIHMEYAIDTESISVDISGLSDKSPDIDTLITHVNKSTGKYIILFCYAGMEITVFNTMAELGYEVDDIRPYGHVLFKKVSPTG